jgi:cell division protein FtsN
MDKSFDRTLLLVSVAAFLVILLILYKLFSWYNSNADSKADGAYEEIITDDMLSDADANSQEVYDIDDPEEASEASSPAAAEELDYAKSKESSTSNDKTKTKSTPKTSAGSTTGEYLVIAGSFKEQNNANQRKEQLVKLGFPAEVVQFDNSSLYSVCAQRLKDKQSAQSVVQKLKNDHSINCYVQRKRQ